MANPEHLKILHQGVEVWNKWRNEHAEVQVDLSGADLHNYSLPQVNLWNTNLIKTNFNNANLWSANFPCADLRGAKLSEASLCYAKLYEADLTGANFSYADLLEATFNQTNLRGVSFQSANLRAANLSETTLCGANLTNANLTKAKLYSANLQGAILHEANFDHAHLGNTQFANLDLSQVKRLSTCIHEGPSSMDIHTLKRSQGLPETFLRGCGLPEILITFLPSIRQAPPIQFYSCFIGHSTKDQLFAERFFDQLQANGVRTFYAPEGIKGGRKLLDQIDSAIHVYDKYLLVLSEHSMSSNWVNTELRRCLKAEKQEGKRKLFPIRLVDMETVRNWECFDADSGMDLAVEVREYFIPDFSHWEVRDSYKLAFDRLLRDLQESVEKEIPLS